MDTHIIFSKTSKGVRAIQEREASLQGRLRHALILVDGHSDVSQLHEKALAMDNLEELLEQLAMQGFIRADDSAWENTESFTRTKYTANHTAIASVKAKLIDAAILVLGKDANKITKILRQAPDTMWGLEAAIEKCRKICDLLIDEKKATELKQKCSQILDNL